MAIDLSELPYFPLEVWRAVEGERSELIALLRSEAVLTRSTREALADWLDGKLGPVKWPKGRPTEGRDLFRPPSLEGHDPTTPLGSAGHHFEALRRFIRKKGWHKKSAGRLHWSSERLMAAVAKRHRIDPETFKNYAGRAKPRQLPRPFQLPDFEEECRRQVAYEIRRGKSAKKADLPS